MKNEIISKIKLPDHIIYALIIFIPFVTLSIWNFMGSWVSPYYLIACSLMLYCFIANPASYLSLFKFRSTFLIILLIVIVVISDISSIYKNILDLKVQFKYLLFLLIYVSITFGIFLSISKSKQLYKTIDILIKVNLFVFIFGIYQFISMHFIQLPFNNIFYNNDVIPGIWPSVHLHYNMRIWATFPEMSVYGNYLLIVLPIILAILLINHQYFKTNKKLVLSTLVLGIMNFLMCSSGGAMFALFFGTILFLCIIYPPGKFINLLVFKPKLIGIFAVSIILCSLLIYPFLSRLDTISNQSGSSLMDGSNSLTTRLSGQKIALNAFNENPLLGIGFGNFSNKYLDYIYQNDIITQEILEYIENEMRLNPYGNFTRMLSETGIIGFVVFIGLIISLILDCIYIIKSKNKNIRKLGYAYLFGFICTNFQGLLDTVFLFPHWWLLCGLIVTTKKLTLKENLNEQNNTIRIKKEKNCLLSA